MMTVHRVKLKHFQSTYNKDFQTFKARVTKSQLFP